MKISNEDYLFMKSEIKKLTPEFIEKMKEVISKDDRVKDSNKRFRWDCYWLTGLYNFAVNKLYNLGVNDSHIDTALKKIVKELNLN